MTTKQPSYLTAPASWMNKPIKVVLIGCGGTGCEVFDILSQQHLALKARGGAGLHVVAYDPSVVREPNLVRQRFWPCDIGQYKAICLANRYNVLLGTDWDAQPTGFPMLEDKVGNLRIDPQSKLGSFDIIISAVDLPSVRHQLSKLILPSSVIWLDFGNGVDFGQAILGVLRAKSGHSLAVNEYPHVLEHYPEFKTMKDNTAKSCSMAESLMTQDILINRSVASAGMNILWQLIKHGKTSLNGCLIDLKASKQTPLFFGQN